MIKEISGIEKIEDSKTKVLLLQTALKTSLPRWRNKGLKD